MQTDGIVSGYIYTSRQFAAPAWSYFECFCGRQWHGGFDSRKLT